MKNAFRSASSIHHKKVFVLRCKVLVLVLKDFKVMVLVLVLNLRSWS